MKKFYSFLFAAVALVGFAACNSDSTEEPAPAQQVGKMEFTANIGEDTKTQLTEGTKVKWCAGDAIAISNGTVVKKYEIKSEMISNNGKTATFEGDPMDGDTFYAVYPYAEGAAYTDGKWNVTIPTEQVAVAGSFADGAALAYGEYQDNYTFSFTNENAVLKFQVPAACEMVEFFNGENSVVKVEGAMDKDKDYYAVVAPGIPYTFTVRIDGYFSKQSTKALDLEKNKIYNLGVLPALEKYTWGLVGQHQGWDITKPSAMYKVADKVYAALNQTLKADGFKFAKTGLANWNTANTYFGAWKKSTGKNYFDFSTEMGAGAWYSVYTNNLGGQANDIGVSDFDKKYDIYVKVITNADWGQELGYTVVEAGTAVTF